MMYLKALQRPQQVPMRCSNEGVLRQRHKFGGLAPREPDHLLLLLQAPSLSPDSLPPVFPEAPLPLFIPWSLISLRTSPSLPSHFLPLIRLCVSAQRRIHILLLLAPTYDAYYLPGYWPHWLRFQGGLILFPHHKRDISKMLTKYKCDSQVF